MRIPWVAALVLAPALAAPEEPFAIDHQEVGCLVAGKHPVLSACFSRPPARARVYFRAPGTPHWYFVDMKQDGACFSGTLPTPKSSLPSVGYYIEAVDPAFAGSRTAEQTPRVVESDAQCDPVKRTAKWVARASVVVGALPGAPAVPAGFAAGGLAGAGGGGSTALVAGVVGGGAAVGGVVALAGRDSDEPPATAPPTTQAPPTTSPPPTTAPPAPNQPPTLVLNVSPRPPTGQSPLTVNFNLCPSSDPENDPLSFAFDFGDGTRDSGACRAEHTYVSSGAAQFGARLCVSDPAHEVCADITVVIEAPPPEHPHY